MTRITALVISIAAVSAILLAIVVSAQKSDEELSNPIAELQRKIDSGEVQFEYEPQGGYLKSVLKYFKIPASSQTLVFSKSNFQLHLVGPDRPRALYFNDEVYAGWVRGGTEIELAALDPKKGPVFYMLPQDRDKRVRFDRQPDIQCVVCHDSSPTEVAVPRLLMLSVLPDPVGSALKAQSLITNDQSPFSERWGGWYVTGEHGKQRHLGNLIVREPASSIRTMREFIPRLDLSGGANLTDLKARFDTKPYLTPHSDIVALMILGHQTHVQNLLTVAGSGVQGILENPAESVLRAMLFSKELALTDPVKGTSGYAEEFAAQGPRDSKGRSLRDLDLKKRLFRYPLSYLIYSKQFDALPAGVKDQIYLRLRQILTGEDKSADFAHLAEADRQAIFEILKETKPGF